MANNIVILVRGDTAANWESKDSLLKLREIGYDQTNRRFKVGDGINTWKTLPYVKPDVIDDLITGGTDKALSAEQGKVLSGLIGDCADDIDTINQNITNLEEKIEGGVAGTIEIGTVTTGAAGSSASVTNVGTASAAKLNFTIPKGDKGATGAQGPQGPQGPQGIKGADAVVLNSGNSPSTTAAVSAYQVKLINDKLNKYSTESWTFKLSTGSTVTKKVVLSS